MPCEGYQVCSYRISRLNIEEFFALQFHVRNLTCNSLPSYTNIYLSHVDSMKNKFKLAEILKTVFITIAAKVLCSHLRSPNSSPETEYEIAVTRKGIYSVILTMDTLSPVTPL